MTPEDDGTIGRIGGSKPTDAVEGAAPAEAAQAADEVGSVAPADASIADALRTGALSAEQAQARIIDEVVRSQLGPEASEEMIAEFRAEVAALLEGDPALAALLEP